MRLTDNQCEKLRDTILNIYPYQKKAALESFFSENFNTNIESIVAYSSIIPPEKLNKIIHTYNSQKGNEEIKILILKIPAKDLDLDKEIYEIESAIDRAKKRCLLNFTTKIVYSTDDIRRNIANENPQIVHFCGHGLNNGSLKLDNDSNSGISPEVLKSIFQGRENIIKCVLLNACHSEKATLAISQHINYAIGMNNEIIDNVAIEFAKGFYDGLGYSNSNNTYGTAFNEGIRAIIAKQKSQELIPILKTRISYEEAIYNLLERLDFENKIDDFIETISTYPDFLNNNLFKRFYSDFSYPVKQPDLLKLKEIVNEIKDWNLVTISYRETLPDNATLYNNELNNPQNIHKIIDILREKYPLVSDNVPSILEFAKNLAGKFPGSDQTYFEIEDWVKKILSELDDISIDVKPRIEDSLTPDQKTFLLIIISPEDNLFRLEAEYILDENQNFKPQPFDFKELLNINFEADNGKGVICSEKEIPSTLEEIIKTFVESFLNKISPPIIEIFSPSKNLGQNIDNEWYINDPYSVDEKVPILQEFNIILHPIERFQKTKINLNFQEVCKKISELLKSQNQTKSISIIEHIQIIDKVDSKNYKQIGIDLRRKKAIGAKINFPLTEKEKEYFWKAIFMGGTPVVFWKRD